MSETPSAEKDARLRGIRLAAIGRRRAKLSLLEREALTSACSRCGAAPGSWCLTEPGRISPTLHLERIERAMR